MVEIVMNNSSGIYQVDGLLKAKLRGSGLEPYVEVVARIDTEAEKRLVPTYRLDFGEPRAATDRVHSPAVAGSSNGGTPGSDQEVGVRIPAPQPQRSCWKQRLSVLSDGDTLRLRWAPVPKSP